MSITFRFIGRALAGLGVLAGQVMHAAHRRDLPSLQNQDPSGDFGSPENPRLRIALLGDSSITAPGVEPLDHCWTRRIAIGLSERYFVELRSVAIGGSRASDVLRDQVETALLLRPDMALLSVGANDALRAVPVRRFERDVDEILHRLTAEIPAVGLSGVGDLGTLPRLPTVGKAWARVRGRAYDNAIRRVVGRYDRVVKSDTWCALWDPFASGDPKLFAADRFHASEAGHAIFAAAMAPVVNELIAMLEPALSARRGSRGSST